MADYNISPDALVSRPTSAFGRLPLTQRTSTAARISCKADGTVIGSTFVVPRTPSVPKSLWLLTQNQPSSLESLQTDVQAATDPG
jgi:hypothetical protein